MTRSGIHIERLAFVGPSRPPAVVDFLEDASVVCGASDTGKSFLVESINFLLGSSNPLRDIPQRVGYDRARLQLRLLGDDQVVTLERSVEGAGFRLIQGAIPDTTLAADAVTLKEQHKHGRADNVSGWLLNQIGLFERRVKKNKDGATNSLSFRNLVDFVLVDEADIITRDSPFLTGQYTTRTAEYATLKLLLTGVDDSALVDTQTVRAEEQSTRIKLEVIQTMIEDLEGEIADVGGEESELADQYARLGRTIEDVEAELNQAQSSVDEALSERRVAVLERRQKQERVDEIGELLARFDLLAAHYASDTNRLEAIREAGTMFAYVGAAACPLCGTPPAEQKHAESCDGDVAAVVGGANAEIRKIALLSEELSRTRSELEEERAGLIQEIASDDRRLFQIGSQLDRLLAPALSRTHGSFRELADQRANVARGLDLYRRLDALRVQRDEVLEEPDTDGGDVTTSSTLSKSVLDMYAEKVEETLNDWHFPSSSRVYFDEAQRDFVIGGKPRGSYGKGFRAITHAAIKLSLMRYCIEAGLPHPGFVVLDSPLLAYWKPEGPGDSLAGSDLKEQFYAYLQAGRAKGQVIVVENEHPPTDPSGMSVTVFTRNPNQGRYGFFPSA